MKLKISDVGTGAGWEKGRVFTDSCFALTHTASLQDVMSTLNTQTASCLSDLPRKMAGVFFLSSHMHTLALRVGEKKKHRVVKANPYHHLILKRED